MKYIFTFLFSLLLLVINVFSQQASDYFPDSTGHKWYFKVSVLDSLNNEVDSLTIHQIDSFAVSQQYEGKLAYHILSKTGLPETINEQPYLDTNYVATEGSDAFLYFNTFNLDSLFPANYSGEKLKKSFPLNFPVLDYSGWYAAYRFDESIGSEYQLVQIDTTIEFENTEIPIRLEVIGERTNDDLLETPIGDFDCKRFIITAKIGIVPFPPFVIPLAEVKDTVWIAEDNFVLQHYTPSTIIDLSDIELGVYTIPGLKVETTEPLNPVYTENKNNIPDKFYLAQNYPNPFNPETSISFNLNENADVNLVVYDILGNKVETLVNGFLNAGKYKVKFNGNHLSTGVYIYKINIYSNNNNFINTKKMLLLK